MRKIPFLLLLLLLFLTSCAEQNTGKTEYEETKKMVVDILKTDEGKKALQEVLSDDEMKQKLVMDQAVVTETIEKTLTSDKGKEFWKKAFEDTEFAESFAKSMQQSHEQLMKNLMNDPDFRGKMLEVMKDPEMTKEISNLLKSKEFRTHLQEVMTETFESPIYKAKVEEVLKNAATKAKEEEEKKKEE